MGEIVLEIKNRRFTFTCDEVEIGREGYYIVAKCRDGTKIKLCQGNMTVSRRHLKIYNTDEGVFIQDMGSKNGTLLNGKSLPGWKRRTKSEKVKINSPADIKIGTFLLKIFVSGEEVYSELSKEDLRTLEMARNLEKAGAYYAAMVLYSQLKLWNKAREMREKYEEWVRSRSIQKVVYSTNVSMKDAVVVGGIKSNIPELGEKEVKEKKAVTDQLQNEDEVARCPYCNSPLPPNANYCPYCAKELPHKKEREEDEGD